MLGVMCCPTHESHSGVPVETERKAIQEFDHEVKWKSHPMATPIEGVSLVAAGGNITDALTLPSLAG